MRTAGRNNVGTRAIELGIVRTQPRAQVQRAVERTLQQNFMGGMQAGRLVVRDLTDLDQCRQQCRRVARLGQARMRRRQRQHALYIAHHLLRCQAHQARADPSRSA